MHRPSELTRPVRPPLIPEPETRTQSLPASRHIYFFFTNLSYLFKPFSAISKGMEDQFSGRKRWRGDAGREEMGEGMDGGEEDAGEEVGVGR